MTHQSQALDTLRGRLGYEIKRASIALHHAMEDAVGPHGLTVAQYACLEVLARNPGASSSDLARDGFVTRQAAHQVIQRLLANDLVRKHAPGNARRQQLELTPAGERLRRQAASAVGDVERRLSDALPPGTDAQVALHLQTITAALNVEREA